MKKFRVRIKCNDFYIVDNLLYSNKNEILKSIDYMLSDKSLNFKEISVDFRKSKPDVFIELWGDK